MFHGWDNFYLMLGSAAGALIGLLFVVVTLTQGRERSQALRGVSIYMTPTAVHFAVVLTASAITSTPRLPVWAAAELLGLAFLVGLGNSIWACIGIRSLSRADEPPHWTDFWCYGFGPATTYLGLTISAVALWSHAAWAPYALAGLLLILLLVGIRNAWDLITWMAPARNAQLEAAMRMPPPSPPAPAPRAKARRTRARKAPS